MTRTEGLLLAATSMIPLITVPRFRAFLATVLSALLIAGCGGGGGAAAPIVGAGDPTPPVTVPGPGPTPNPDPGPTPNPDPGPAPNPDPAPSTTTYRLSADVSGLLGAGLVLSLDQAEDVTVTGNGSISFARQIAGGQSFSLVVKTQPAGPAQYCTVEAAVQPIDSDTTVAVRCEFPPPKFVYVGGFTGIDVMRADAATGALAPVQAVALAETGRLALTEDQSLLIAYNGPLLSAQLTTFRVDASTGKLAPTQSAPFALGTSIGGIAAHPNGSRVYVAQQGTNRIQSLRLDSVTGQLSSQSSINVPSTPLDVAISRDGRFAYVAYRNGVVQSFEIDAAGDLTALETVNTGLTQVASFTLDPQQQYLYFGGPNAATSLGRDPVTGTLTPISRVDLAGTSDSLAVHPGGNYLYAHISGSDVYAFAVDPGTGGLAPVGSSTPPHLTLRLVGVGRFLMATSYTDSDISVYTLDAATGQPAFVGSTSTSPYPRSVVTTTLK